MSQEATKVGREEKERFFGPKLKEKTRLLFPSSLNGNFHFRVVSCQSLRSL